MRRKRNSFHFSSNAAFAPSIYSSSPIGITTTSPAFHTYSNKTPSPSAKYGTTALPPTTNAGNALSTKAAYHRKTFNNSHRIDHSAMPTYMFYGQTRASQLLQQTTISSPPTTHRSSCASRSAISRHSSWAMPPNPSNDKSCSPIHNSPPTPPSSKLAITVQRRLLQSPISPTSTHATPSSRSVQTTATNSHTLTSNRPSSSKKLKCYVPIQTERYKSHPMAITCTYRRCIHDDYTASSSLAR